MKEYRVLVCGGRYYNNKEKMFSVLNRVLQICNTNGKTLIIIHGAAPGADRLCGLWADTHLPIDNVRAFPADWDRYRKAAGPIRNQQMLVEGKPHVIIAFKGGTGTANMTSIGKKANVPVLTIVD